MQIAIGYISQMTSVAVAVQFCLKLVHDRMWNDHSAENVFVPVSLV